MILLKSTLRKLMRRMVIRKCCVYRRCSTQRPEFCIVGSGPAGFYTAQGLQKLFPNAFIDVYDKFPFPFGLVRFGVAPDHPEVKNAINTFNKTASKEGFSFLGNVDVGVDVSVEQLQNAYHAVVICTGAEDDKRFGIKGEDLENVISARSFVGWYNGHPDHANLKVNLDVETVAVFGHGNVALDVARIILNKVDDLKTTDITEYALEALSHSRVRKVYLIGRRGPLQVAFTIKEFREMINLKDCQKIIRIPQSMDLNPSVFEGLPRPRKRLTELMVKNAQVETSLEESKMWELKFLRSPNEFLPSSDNKSLAAVRLQLNKLVEEKAISTDESEELDCQLALTSIGYRGLPIDSSLPFCTQRGVVMNKNGKVDNRPGLYCSGWAATGPMGVIATTLDNGFLLSRTLADDVKNGRLNLLEPKDGKAAILDVLKKRNAEVVHFEDWLKIDREEVRRGQMLRKPREKITNVKESLRIAR